MTPDDIGEVKRLLDICFGESAWSEASVRSQLEKSDSLCTVAVGDDCIVGYLAFEVIADEGSVVELAVHPYHRRQGIARELIQGALDNCPGMSAVYLEVRQSNITAISLYRSLGFEEIGTRRDYYDDPKEDAVIHRLPLVKGAPSAGG